MSFESDEIERLRNELKFCQSLMEDYLRMAEEYRRMIEWYRERYFELVNAPKIRSEVELQLCDQLELQAQVWDKALKLAQDLGLPQEFTTQCFIEAKKLRERI